ncbi:MAG TPA: molybdenum cofactor guanylyltransferase [Bryobacteraceae bacterium]|nr:molybdenum cofactor guanylyltransferase [Bryobacteraceae bacterium]
MSRAGFVLVGGKSSRMGRDKALLPFGGKVLAQHIATLVQAAAGSSTLIGDPERYAVLGYPVRADLYPRCGPIGGIATALRITTADWNLVVACDMPALTAAVLNIMLQKLDQTDADCIVPTGISGPEPVCAVYHRRSLPHLEQAMRDGRLKMREVILDLKPELVPVPDPTVFANLNTPDDLLTLQA